MPKLSVVLPVYNVAPFLGETIASISAQCERDFEVIAVDDGSRDGSGAMLDAWAARDPRVRVVHHHVNRRISAALNTGLDHARARLVVRADGDDVNLPGRFAALRRAAESHPRCAVIGSAFHLHNGRAQRFPAGTAAVRARLLFSSPFGHPAVLLNRDVLGAVRYAEEFAGVEDFHLWWRVAFTHPVMNLATPLVRYRQRTDSACHLFNEARLEQERRLDTFMAAQLGCAFAPDVGLAFRAGNRIARVPHRAMTRHLVRVLRRGRELGLAAPGALRREALHQYWCIVRRYGRGAIRREWPGLSGSLLRALPGVVRATV